jgi:hypothetical protein
MEIARIEKQGRSPKSLSFTIRPISKKIVSLSIVFLMLHKTIGVYWRLLEFVRDNLTLSEYIGEQSIFRGNRSPINSNSLIIASKHNLKQHWGDTGGPTKFRRKSTAKL